MHQLTETLAAITTSENSFVLTSDGMLAGCTWSDPVKLTRRNVIFQKASASDVFDLALENNFHLSN